MTIPATAELNRALDQDDLAIHAMMNIHQVNKTSWFTFLLTLLPYVCTVPTSIESDAMRSQRQDTYEILEERERMRYRRQAKLQTLAIAILAAGQLLTALTFPSQLRVTAETLWVEWSWTWPGVLATATVVMLIQHAATIVRYIKKIYTWVQSLFRPSACTTSKRCVQTTWRSG